MATRPVYLATLGAVIVGAGAYVAVPAVRHAHDQHDLRAARAAAHRVALPADSAPSRECHGDGLVACAVVHDTTTAAVSRDLVEAVERAAGRSVSADCIQVAHGPATGHQRCLIAARWGDHGVFAFVGPHVFADHGQPAVEGVLISLSTD